MRGSGRAGGGRAEGRRTRRTRLGAGSRFAGGLRAGVVPGRVNNGYEVVQGGPGRYARRPISVVATYRVQGVCARSCNRTEARRPRPPAHLLWVMWPWRLALLCLAQRSTGMVIQRIFGANQSEVAFASAGGGN